MKKRRPYDVYYPRKRKKISVFTIFVFLIFFLVGAYIIFKMIDRKMFPLVVAMNDFTIKNSVNNVINESIKKTTEDYKLITKDFYQWTQSKEDKMGSVTVNTVLVNDFCNAISTEISFRLQKLEKEKISIPLGAITGIRLLSNIGPKYTVFIQPMGNANVDYDSSFVSTGINQINFQIWLNISSEVRLVNPLEIDTLSVTRKVPLINTIINSDMPNNVISPLQIQPSTTK